LIKEILVEKEYPPYEIPISNLISRAYFRIMNLTERRRNMLSLADHWQNSGLSQREFSRIHGIDFRQLNYWIKAEAESSISKPSGSFIPLEPSNENNSQKKIEVVFPSGIIIRTVFEQEIIQQLLSLS